jgi:uncharacterized protein YbjT (DUF2867 family)
VFGATGGVGRHVVTQALDRGDRVTAARHQQLTHHAGAAAAAAVYGTEGLRFES